MLNFDCVKYMLMENSDISKYILMCTSYVSKYIEDIQMVLLNMSFISRVKWTISIFMSGEATNKI